MPRFTADQIHTLIGALPSHVAKRKRTVLRLMIEEWGRIDLEEHLKRSMPQHTRGRKKAMCLVAKRAEEFAGALASLDGPSRFAVARRLFELETGADFWSSPRERVREVEHRLADEPQKLQRLAEAAERGNPLEAATSSARFAYPLFDVAGPGGNLRIRDQRAGGAAGARRRPLRGGEGLRAVLGFRKHCMDDHVRVTRWS